MSENLSEQEMEAIRAVDAEIAAERARLQQEQRWHDDSGYLPGLDERELELLVLVNQLNLDSFEASQLFSTTQIEPRVVSNCLRRLANKTILVYDPSTERFTRPFSSEDEMAIIRYEAIRRRRILKRIFGPGWSPEHTKDSKEGPSP